MNKKIVSIASLSFLGLVYCSSASAELKPFYEKSADELHCGYKNDKEKIVINAKYDGCGTFSDGLAAVFKDGEDYTQLQGFVDETGRLVIPIEHEVNSDERDGDYKSFSDGLIAVYRNGAYGYMNKYRDLVIPYTYKDASNFKDGLAIVSRKGKYGVIDKAGKIVVPLNYDWLSNYSDGLALYTDKNHWNDGFSYGYIDKKGNIAIKAKWNRACEFSEGLAAVRVGDYDSGKWGIVDKLGHYVVNPIYDEPAIQTWSHASYGECYYQGGKINMYNYTDPSNPYESSITRYTLNRQGGVVGKKFYSNWESIINEFIENDGL